MKLLIALLIVAFILLHCNVEAKRRIFGRRSDRKTPTRRTPVRRTSYTQRPYVPPVTYNKPKKGKGIPKKIGKGIAILAGGAATAYLGKKVLKGLKPKRPKFGFDLDSSDSDEYGLYGPYYRVPPYYRRRMGDGIYDGKNYGADGTYVDCQSQSYSSMLGTMVNIYGSLKGPIEFIKSQILCFMPSILPSM